MSLSTQLKVTAASVLGYLRDAPGAVSLIVSEAVLLVAKVGLHVSAATVYQVGAVMLPLVLGYFHVARKASVKAAAKDAPTP